MQLCVLKDKIPTLTVQDRWQLVMLLEISSLKIILGHEEVDWCIFVHNHS